MCKNCKSVMRERYWTVTNGTDFQSRKGCTECYADLEAEDQQNGWFRAHRLEEVQPNPYACVVTALAFCTGIDVCTLMGVAGHDGTVDQRGFKPEEFTGPLLDLGIALCTHPVRIWYGEHPDGRQIVEANKHIPIDELGMVLVDQKDHCHMFGVTQDLWYDPTTGVYIAPRTDAAIAYYTVHMI